MRNLLLIIDPQNDFVNPSGSLPVKGALEDMGNIVNMVKTAGRLISDIIVTMDTHHPVHIASPCYWKNPDGRNPLPFTRITYSDLKNGVWLPVYEPSDAAKYLMLLEQAGRVNTIWPAHTLYGSCGWAVYEPVYKALYEWSFKYGRNFELYTKGQNSTKTEMFSAIRPEISLNTAEDNKNAIYILGRFKEFDRIYIGGEAEDFCVKETVKDMLELDSSIPHKLYILKDCMSRIVSKCDDTDNFWKRCEALGVNFINSADLR